MVTMPDLSHTEHPGEEFQVIELEPRTWLSDKSTKKLLIILDDKPTKTSKPRYLNLDLKLPDGSNLQDQLNIKWLYLIIKCIYLIRDDQDQSITTAHAHTNLISKILTFLFWCRLKGFYSLENVTPDVVEQFSSDIALGTGYALQYADRITAYFNQKNVVLPTHRSSHYEKRVILDTEQICTEIGIPKQGLSADRTASQVIARKSAEIGYRYPGQQKVTEGPLPAPIAVSAITHKRFIHAVRLLYKWNSQLDGLGLNFVGCPLATNAPRSQLQKQKTHTKNIPPVEAMELLNEALLWIHSYAPKILDLFDDVEQELNVLMATAQEGDRLLTPESMLELRLALNKYLMTECEAGRFPHGTVKLLSKELNLSYQPARDILDGNFNTFSRAAVFKWLGLTHPIDDNLLLNKVRKKISEKPIWKGVWPFTLWELAQEVGIEYRSLERFMFTNQSQSKQMLLVIQKFLMDKGLLHNTKPRIQTLDSLRYRNDQGIAPKIESFIKNHPLNSDDGSGPFPLKWNLTLPSRAEGMSLFEAVRFAIPTAGVIVLGVFTARRESEIFSLTTDCVTKVDDQLWLDSYIAKTLRENRQIPTIQGVATTVELLKRWGQRGKNSESDNRLFSFWEPFGDLIQSTKPNEDLNRFAKISVKTPLTHSLQIRQFRRFFAITFMWRYRHGSLPALSDFLCHRGISMTWEYVTEVVGSAVLLEAQSEFSRELLVSTVQGDTSITGNFAKPWNRWIEKVRAQIRDSITFSNDPEAATALFEERITAGMRMLMPMPYGACAAGNRERDNRRAKCATPATNSPEKTTKNPGLATAAICSQCPFLVTDDVHKEYWISAANDARTAAASSTPSLLRERALQDAPKLHSFVQKFFNENTQ